MSIKTNVKVHTTDPVFQNEVVSDKTELRDGDTLVGYVHTPTQSGIIRHYTVQHPSGNEQKLGFLKNSAFELLDKYFVEDMFSEMRDDTIYNLLIIGVKNG